MIGGALRGTGRLAVHFDPNQPRGDGGKWTGGGAGKTSAVKSARSKSEASRQEFVNGASKDKKGKWRNDSSARSQTASNLRWERRKARGEPKRWSGTAEQSRDLAALRASGGSVIDALAGMGRRGR